MIKQEDWKLKECNLFQPVKEYFQNLGFTVAAEVPTCGMALCDLGAVNNGISIAVELKTSLSKEVIRQAYLNDICADVVYAAIPTNPRSLATAKLHGIGVIQVKNGIVNILLDPKMESAPIETHKKRFVENIKDLSQFKNEVGGLPNMKGTGPAIDCQKRIDQYIEKVDYKPSWKELWQCVDNHYCSPSSMASALVKERYA